MANYYTGWSFMVPLADRQKSEELERRIRRELEVLEERLYESETDEPNEPLEILGSWIGEGYVPDLHVEAQDEGLWFTHDESGDVEAAAQVAQWVLNQLPDGPDFIGFGYANWASRPICGSYSGGECLVTRDEIFWWPPYERLMKKARELREQGMEGEVA
jgi:hypothetical protein